MIGQQYCTKMRGHGLCWGCCVRRIWQSRGCRWRMKCSGDHLESRLIVTGVETLQDTCCGSLHRLRLGREAGNWQNHILQLSNHLWHSLEKPMDRRRSYQLYWRMEMVVESNMREMMMETVCTGPVSHTGSSCCIARSPATLFSVCQELSCVSEPERRRCFGRSLTCMWPGLVSVSDWADLVTMSRCVGAGVTTLWLWQSCAAAKWMHQLYFSGDTLVGVVEDLWTMFI